MPPSDGLDSLAATSGTAGALTFFLVEIIKQVTGWEGRRVVVVAFIVGQFFAVGTWAATQWNEIQTIYTVIVTGLMSFASGVGMFSLKKRDATRAANETKSPSIESGDPHG